MDEHVLARLALDEAETFGCIEPLHCTFFFHYRNLFEKITTGASSVPAPHKKTGLPQFLPRSPENQCDKGQAPKKRPAMQNSIPYRNLRARGFRAQRRRFVRWLTFLRGMGLRWRDEAHFLPGCDLPAGGCSVGAVRGGVGEDAGAGRGGCDGRRGAGGIAAVAGGDESGGSDFLGVRREGDAGGWWTVLGAAAAGSFDFGWWGQAIRYCGEGGGWIVAAGGRFSTDDADAAGGAVRAGGSSGTEGDGGVWVGRR